MRSGAAVMLQQALPYVAGSHADDRVLPRIVGQGAAEHFHADDPLLEGIETPCERLLNDMPQELTASMASLKGCAFENFLHVQPEIRDFFL